ncbi:hypothetical protein C8R45DRAFT_929928 [Mycena sanguinolenta]|nr:hypothetical protein C8R45DRAFT_929928 [Mycena sanguinolenta]
MPYNDPLQAHGLQMSIAEIAESVTTLLQSFLRTSNGSINFKEISGGKSKKSFGGGQNQCSEEETEQNRTGMKEVSMKYEEYLEVWRQVHEEHSLTFVKWSSYFFDDKMFIKCMPGPVHDIAHRAFGHAFSYHIDKNDSSRKIVPIGSGGFNMTKEVGSLEADESFGVLDGGGPTVIIECADSESYPHVKEKLKKWFHNFCTQTLKLALIIKIYHDHVGNLPAAEVLTFQVMLSDFYPAGKLPSGVPHDYTIVLDSAWMEQTMAQINYADVHLRQGRR